ncbi:transmembrane 220 family protein [Arenibacter certesii]|uniref:Transmembrane family 220, helix n=1 Tax=Arenibacter certesii TaxID=228955 RepID=A0A918MKY9_9FLAO|nr:transmembrane 220 family protein [Arenibacter certesii]GGW33014.1 hypothetical protein GCM10007383_17460 [Arenibacter certesii]
MKLFSKIFAFIFAFLFIWSAVLQYNDQDAWLWYAIYGSAALASIFFVFDRLLLSIGVFLSFLYLISSYIFWPEKYEGVSIGGGDINNIERARESLGLLISAMVMLFYAWRIKLSRKA